MSVATTDQGRSGTVCSFSGSFCWWGLRLLQIMHALIPVSVSSFTDGQNTLSLALPSVDSTPGCPLCNAFKYLESKDAGITALLPFMMMLSSTVSLPRKNKKWPHLYGLTAYKSWPSILNETGECLEGGVFSCVLTEFLKPLWRYQQLPQTHALSLFGDRNRALMHKRGHQPSRGVFPFCR